MDMPMTPQLASIYQDKLLFQSRALAFCRPERLCKRDNERRRALKARRATEIQIG